MNYPDIRLAAYAANRQLPELGLVLFTFGNASAVDREAGVFAIKPSGVPYLDLGPEDMVILDFEGKIVEGKMRPSSDAKTHALLYKEWTNIGGIVHTHSTYGTAWAQAKTTRRSFLPAPTICASGLPRSKSGSEVSPGDWETAL